MHWISTIGYKLFALTGSGYDGSFQPFVHEYGIQFPLLSLEHNFHIFFADFHNNSLRGHFSINLDHIQ
jgi:hypothetical protein